MAERSDATQSSRSSAERREKKIGSYVVGNMIGKGGFGCVYKALDHQRGGIVAIKQVGLGMMNASDLGSIELEISLLSKLKHRNIVKYIDSIRKEHHLNIVLEFVEGGSLASILKKFGAFPETLCAIYTLQILKGLQYLHCQGVIHRDIKGANVLTTKTGLVKLADFGVAMKISEVDSSKRRVVGTPYWMAPEIVEMSPPTPACDIWSVGSTVVEMITEKPPYGDLQQVSALYRIVSDAHPPLPDGISSALESFLLLCFEKSHFRRPSARELLSDVWIVSNKQHTLEFTRKMMSPSHQQENNVELLPCQDVHVEEEDEADEEEEALSMFVQTIKTMNESREAAMDHEPGDATSPAKAASEAVVVPAPLDNACEEIIINGGSAEAEGDQALDAVAATDGGDAVPQTDESLRPRLPTMALHPPEDVAPRQPEPEVHAVDASAAGASRASVETAASGAGDSVQNQYHFAFLDYYNKHYVAPEKKKSAPSAGTPRRSQSFCFGNVDTAGAIAASGGISESRTEDVAPTVSVAEAAGGPDISTGGSSPTCPKDLGRPPAIRSGDETPLPPPPFTDSTVAHHAKDCQREAAEIKQLLNSIRPFEEPKALLRICKRLMELLQQGGNEVNNLNLVTQHGAVPIVEMLQVTDPTLLRTVLRVVNQIVEGNHSFQDCDVTEIFAMVGLIPGVIKFARPHHDRPLRYEAAWFVLRLCHTSPRSLQMLVACGGLEALVDLVSHEYYHNRDLVWIALDALTTVFESAPQSSQKKDFCRILAKRGLCGHLCLLIDTLAADIHERAARYLKIVVDLLLFFAREGDAVVKVYMAKSQVLEGLVSALEFLPLDLQVQICKTFKNLAQEPSVLNMLENAGIVPVLARVLSWHCGPPSKTDDSWDHTNGSSGGQSQDACSQCLLALFYLCKLSRPRQEQAALAGVTPLLQDIVAQQHNLRVYAFEMLCDMTRASLATRRILWAEDGVAFFVRNLSSPEFQTFALDALVGWLGQPKEHRVDWCSRVEGVLLKDELFLGHLLTLFRASRASLFMKILDPLLKLLRVSQRINVAVAGSDDFFKDLVGRFNFSQRYRQGSIGENMQNMAHFNGTNTLDCFDVDPATAADMPAAPAVVGTMEQSPFSSRKNSLSWSQGVRRLVSEPAVVASDDVRARTHLLRLLQLVCQAQSREQLMALCQRFRLQMLMHRVVQEERRRGRVILCEIASQLLELFGESASVPNTDAPPLDRQATT